MPESGEGDERDIGRGRSLWSGVITFGLVSVPVDLFPANRGRSVGLRMIDEDGTPLRRRYFCPEEDEVVEWEEIVRGYETEKDRYVVVTDEELDSLEPKKSREIDLRRFVELAEIDPMYFERAYFLAPASESNKAYRLLARAMEDAGRAGIATFVMRGKEYLVALISEEGILRAETLRFHAELRSPSAVGLPKIGKPDAALVKDMEAAIRKLAAKEFDRDELTDDYAGRLEKLVRRKLKSGKDVVELPEGTGEEVSGGAEVIDIMEILKQRLEGQGRAPRAAAKSDGGTKKAGPLEERSKEELYARAQELDIAGRSSMSKKQLAQAIRKAE